MVAGFGVLAIVFLMPDLQAMGAEVDFEIILPQAIERFIPIGFKGLLIAGLLAAFMGTFAAFINAAPAYIVNDLYKKYINPTASDKRYIRFSFLSAVILVLVGVIMGFFADSINSLTLWITSALYGGYAAANVLKWIWWRFNGYGYFFGMLGGLIASTFVPIIFPDTSPIYLFPIILGASFLGCIAGTYGSAPNDDDVLINFYKQTKPWGFWRPVVNMIKAADPAFVENKNFSRDLFNVIVGIVWQMTLTIMPIYIVMKYMKPFGITLFIFVITSIILKINWYDKLDKEKPVLSYQNN